MLIGNKFKVFRSKSYHFFSFFYISARKSHKMCTISVCCVQLYAPQSAGSGRNEVCGASVFRPQTKKISSAVEINFVCVRNENGLRTKFISTADDFSRESGASKAAPPRAGKCGFVILSYVNG